MILDIVKWDRTPTNILRKMSFDIDVTKFDRDLKDFIDNMTETMFAANGVGLAAPQVGQNLNLFVMRTEQGIINDTQETRVVINPKTITESGDLIKDIEGCLSIPGLLGRVERRKAVSFAYHDLEGRQHQEGLEGLQARIYLHETNHLRAILFIDIAESLYTYHSDSTRQKA
jgi:peptide deformylase